MKLIRVLDKYALVPMIFFIAIFCLNSEIIQHELNPDEGINLVKAELLTTNHSFTKEIWSDQPPFLSYTISFLSNMFENKFLTNRLLVILFSTILFGAFYKTIRLSLSVPLAMVISCVLVVQGQVSFFTSSILIGIPSLSLAMLSLCISLYYTKDSFLRGAGAGLIFGLAMFTKFIAILFLPAIMLALYRGHSKYKKNLITFFSALILISLVFVISFDLLYNDSLIMPHVDGFNALKKPFGEKIQDISIHYNLVLFALLFVITIWDFVQNRKLETLIILSLAVPTLCFLLFHNPLWSHHYMIPAFGYLWMTGNSLTFLKEIVTKGNLALSHMTTTSITIIALGFTYMVGSKEYQKLTNDKDQLKSQSALIEVLEQSPSNALILTDKPIFPILSKRQTLPELACFSSKRIAAGHISEASIVELIEKYSPQVVLVGRFHDFFNREQIRRLLERDYEIVFENKINSLEHAVVYSRVVTQQAQ